MSFKDKVLKIVKYKHAKKIAASALILGMSAMTVQLDLAGDYWHASTLQRHAAFDGTVMPVQLARDVVNMTSEEYYSPCWEVDSSKFVQAPLYDSNDLTFPTSSLVWGDAEHDDIRIAKTFYSVTHTGNYEWDDSAEGAGSHNGMDIVMCEGTEIHSIANGYVYAAGYSGSWGNYVVIEHNNVPDPDTGESTTLYSSYNHLSEGFVEEGDTVKKNDVIGEMGMTGTATTPHLHFSIEREHAPFLPYWAFTSSDAAAQGYGFWDAVNAGIGQANLYEYTVHPMEFVQAHLDGGTDDYEIYTEEHEEDLEEGIWDEDSPSRDSDGPSVEVDHEIPMVLPEPLGEIIDDGEITEIELSVPGELAIGERGQFSVKLYEDNGGLYRGPFDGQIDLEISDPDVATLSTDYLVYEDFDGGKSSFTVHANRSGEYEVIFTYAGVEYVSQTQKVDDDSDPFDHFEIVTDGEYSPGYPEVIQIHAVDSRGELTTRYSGKNDLDLKIIEGDGELSMDEFSAEDFADDGLVELEVTGTDYEGLVLELDMGTKEVTEHMDAVLFNDFSDSDDYFDAVLFLHQAGTITGYPDGTFQPSRASSRIETLKIVLDGLDQELIENATVKYNDTSMGEWYSPFLATASELGIANGYSDRTFRPSQSMNRVEFLKVLFSSIGANEDLNISVDPVVLKDPYRDVNKLSWYAPYVQFAEEYNLFPGAGLDFNPAREITRVEVSTVIYRLLAVLENAEDTGELEAYTSFMTPSLD